MDPVPGGVKFVFSICFGTDSFVSVVSIPVQFVLKQIYLFVLFRNGLKMRNNRNKFF
jgi:hypothetical protein